MRPFASTFDTPPPSRSPQFVGQAYFSTLLSSSDHSTLLSSSDRSPVRSPQGEHPRSASSARVRASVRQRERNGQMARLVQVRLGQEALPGGVSGGVASGAGAAADGHLTRSVASPAAGRGPNVPSICRARPRAAARAKHAPRRVGGTVVFRRRRRSCSAEPQSQRSRLREGIETSEAELASSDFDDDARIEELHPLKLRAPLHTSTPAAGGFAPYFENLCADSFTRHVISPAAPGSGALANVFSEVPSSHVAETCLLDGHHRAQPEAEPALDRACRTIETGADESRSVQQLLHRNHHHALFEAEHAARHTLGADESLNNGSDQTECTRTETVIGFVQPDIRASEAADDDFSCVLELTAAPPPDEDHVEHAIEELWAPHVERTEAAPLQTTPDGACCPQQLLTQEPSFKARQAFCSPKQNTAAPEGAAQVGLAKSPLWYREDLVAHGCSKLPKQQKLVFEPPKWFIDEKQLNGTGKEARCDFNRNSVFQSLAAKASTTAKMALISHLAASEVLNGVNPEFKGEIEQPAFATLSTSTEQPRFIKLAIPKNRVVPKTVLTKKGQRTGELHVNWRQMHKKTQAVWLQRAARRFSAGANQNCNSKVAKKLQPQAMPQNPASAVEWLFLPHNRAPKSSDPTDEAVVITNKFALNGADAAESCMAASCTKPGADAASLNESKKPCAKSTSGADRTTGSSKSSLDHNLIEKKPVERESGASMQQDGGEDRLDGGCAGSDLHQFPSMLLSIPILDAELHDERRKHSVSEQRIGEKAFGIRTAIDGCSGEIPAENAASTNESFEQPSSHAQGLHDPSISWSDIISPASDLSESSSTTSSGSWSTIHHHEHKQIVLKSDVLLNPIAVSPTRLCSGYLLSTRIVEQIDSVLGLDDSIYAI